MVQTRDAKNPWARSGCHFDIATNNIRSLKADERLEELEYELAKMNWGIVDQTRRRRMLKTQIGGAHFILYRS